MYSCYGGHYDYGCCTELTFSGQVLNYWERSFFQRLTTLFKIDGFPEPGKDQVQIDYDAFLYALCRCGYLVAFQTKKWGITYQYGAPYGIGLQYQPTGMTVSTPYFQFDRPLIINRECAVIKLTPDYTGIWDIVSKYAQEMLYIDVAIRQSSLNARFAYAIAAEDDKSRRSAEALFERLANGDPGIIYDVEMRKRMTKNGIETEMPWQQFDRDLKQNFILPELLEARRTIITDFYREMGVPVPSEKKERVNVTESQQNLGEVFNRRNVWKRCLDESLEIYNRMYEQNMTAEFSDEAALKEMANMQGGDVNEGNQDDSGEN